MTIGIGNRRQSGDGVVVPRKPDEEVDRVRIAVAGVEHFRKDFGVVVRTPLRTEIQRGTFAVARIDDAADGFRRIRREMRAGRQTPGAIVSRQT